MHPSAGSIRIWCVIHVHVSLGACPKRDWSRIVGSGKRYIHTRLLHTHIILLCLIILHTYAPHPPPTPRIYLFILQQVGTVLQEMWREGLLCYAMYGLKMRKRTAVIWLQRLKVTLVPHQKSTCRKFVASQAAAIRTEVLRFLYCTRFVKVKTTVCGRRNQHGPLNTSCKMGLTYTDVW